MTPDELAAIIREHERRAHAAGVVEGLRRGAWEAAEMSRSMRELWIEDAHECFPDLSVKDIMLTAGATHRSAEVLRDMADELEAQQGEQDGD